MLNLFLEILLYSVSRKNAKIKKNPKFFFAQASFLIVAATKLLVFRNLFAKLFSAKSRKNAKCIFIDIYILNKTSEIHKIKKSWKY